MSSRRRPCCPCHPVTACTVCTPLSLCEMMVAALCHCGKILRFGRGGLGHELKHSWWWTGWLLWCLWSPVHVWCSPVHLISSPLVQALLPCTTWSGLSGDLGLSCGHSSTTINCTDRICMIMWFYTDNPHVEFLHPKQCGLHQLYYWIAFIHCLTQIWTNILSHYFTNQFTM